MTAFDRPLTLAEILDLPLQLLRREYRDLLPVAVVGTFAATLPVMIPQVILVMNPTPPPDVLAAVQILNVGMAVISGLLGLIVSLAIVHKLKATLDEEPLTVLGALRRSLSAWALVTLIGAFFLTLVGCILCCLPGIVVACYISLLTPLLVYEPIRGAEAIGRSFTLVHYNPAPGLGRWTFARVLAVYIVFLLFSYALSSLVSIPVGVSAAIIGVRSLAEGADPNALPQSIQIISFITQIISTLVQSVARLYVVMAFTLLYVSVRNAREGQDITASLRELAPERP